MDTFPSIMAPSSIERTISDPYIESQFESGDDAARPIFSIPREGPTALKWSSLRKSQFETLRAFCAAHRAVRFLWTHPSEKKLYVVRLKADALRWSEVGTKPGTYAVDLNMQIIREA